MAALTADVHLAHKGDPKIIELPAAGADTFYVGAVAVADTGGRVQVAGHASGDRFVGIVTEQKVATAQGDLVKIATGGTWLLPVAGGAITDQESTIYVDISAASDNPADLLVEGGAVESGVDPAMGVCTKFEASASLWVNIERRNNPTLAA